MVVTERMNEELSILRQQPMNPYNLKSKQMHFCQTVSETNEKPIVYLKNR